ncbi:MAG: pseudouridine synthase [Candidatus Zambryskibacteria bacterium]|nr:pseudouridine synthase [Candidatus Zambryskibacteria bacterium]
MEEKAIRINKYLALKGYETRRGADEIITKGLVTINGKRAVLGDKVTEADVVVVKQKRKPTQYVYLAYNKPKGIVTTGAQGEEKEIVDAVHYRTRVFPIGRLDKDSYGLIILTNDGRITDRLLNPEKNHEKEYVVTVNKKFTPAFMKHMSSGIDIGDHMTKPAKFKKIKEDVFSLTLTEGKNRQIRRMTEKLGYTVTDLKRVRVQNIELNAVKPGQYREIVDEEQEVFLNSLGL